MMRQLIEKEVSAAKNAVHAVREWIHHRVQRRGHITAMPVLDV